LRPAVFSASLPVNSSATVRSSMTRLADMQICPWCRKAPKAAADLRGALARPQRLEVRPCEPYEHVAREERHDHDQLQEAGAVVTADPAPFSPTISSHAPQAPWVRRG
jgi:hypothetical protein